jgi:hypothetical protein
MDLAQSRARGPAVALAPAKRLKGKYRASVLPAMMDAVEAWYSVATTTTSRARHTFKNVVKSVCHDPEQPQQVAPVDALAAEVWVDLHAAPVFTRRFCHRMRRWHAAVSAAHHNEVAAVLAAIVATDPDGARAGAVRRSNERARQQQHTGLAASASPAVKGMVALPQLLAHSPPKVVVYPNPAVMADDAAAGPLGSARRWDRMSARSFKVFRSAAAAEHKRRSIRLAIKQGLRGQQHALVQEVLGMHAQAQSIRHPNPFT